MDLIQVLGTSTITAVIVIALNAALAYSKERRERTETIQFQALRLALAFESYAMRCADMISDIEMIDESDGNLGKRHCKLPVFELPEEIEWKQFDIQLTNRALSFEFLVRHGNDSIDFDVAITIPPDVISEPEFQAGLSGYRAQMLASDLRAKFCLVARERSVHGWNYESVLKKYHDQKMDVYDSVRRTRESNRST